MKKEKPDNFKMIKNWRKIAVKKIQVKRKGSYER